MMSRNLRLGLFVTLLTGLGTATNSSAAASRNAQSLAFYLQSIYRRMSSGSRLSLAATSILISILPALYWLTSKRYIKEYFGTKVTKPNDLDTPFIREFSTTEPFHTQQFSYPHIRVFYHPYQNTAKLPRSLPLIVFVHGLGGQIAQFQHLIRHYSKISHVLAIDLPGCGDSDLAPKTWAAYTTDALSDLVRSVIEAHVQPKQSYILIAHSLGCAISATLLSKGAVGLDNECSGFVAICPKAASFTDAERKQISIITALPYFVFDSLRYLDRRGGIHSPSVNRFVSPKASLESRQLQLRYNDASQTPTASRFLKGASPPPKEAWVKIDCPVLLISAPDDKVTPKSNVDLIMSFFASKGLEAFEKIQTASIEDSGHSVLHEKPQELDLVITNFLSSHVNSDLEENWQAEQLRKIVL